MSDRYHLHTYITRMRFLKLHLPKALGIKLLVVLISRIIFQEKAYDVPIEFT